MKKMNIFISSVQKEFAKERQTLYYYLMHDPLLGSFFEPFLFENLPAIDQTPDKSYISEVTKCDIYIGLFGAEYGFEDTNGIFPTEKEYIEATKLHKSRFIYVKGDSSIKRHPKIKKLIEKVSSTIVRKRFNAEAELNTCVYASLINYLKEKELIRTCPFDAASSNAIINDIDGEKVRAFVTKARSIRNFPLATSASVNEILVHLNILNQTHLTNAAILLFGKNTQKFIQCSEVKCAHFHGKQVAKPIPSYQLYKGDVFELVDKSVDFILSKLNVEVGTRDTENQVPVKYEIPRAVVSEAIVNAIAHRDYSSNGSVQVMLFSDRLEIWNPGSLPSSLTLKQLKEIHGSVPFNPLLAEPMYLAGYIEKLGSGTQDMFKLCEEAGLKEPKFSLDDGFRVIVWRSKDAVNREATMEVSGEVSGEVKRVVLVLDGEMKRIKIQEILDLKHQEYFRNNYLLPSLESGYIEMTFPDSPYHPKQRYRLTKKGELLKKLIKKTKK